jgi:hypothetical protein
VSGLTNDVMALPAAPTHASALLDLEMEHRRIPMSARTFLTGIKAVDQGVSPSLWTGGKLIGVASAIGPWVRSRVQSIAFADLEPAHRGDHQRTSLVIL